MITMTITGINESISNIHNMGPAMINRIKPEVNNIGRDFLEDVRGVTPVVTGQLKKSAYYSEGEVSPFLIEGSVGYTAPYAPEVEFRRGMLADTLNDWNEKIRQQIITAGLQALGL
ncbi:hypothetical protein A2Z67_06280 [Candidatus Woesebacteria bacterium RBG_13_36_22]|uniref:Uncharacterized protein n=1 Tax=Candidatus Woesebacteria bacterium RBG_13_36_22 TaxID=1802478 RepID=A0A1F7WZC7_9BACT|nr:MAG: hypothetical protein A2Z67_06280 [Candidatus Woesebacteria bacterium RBG_13_36_22]